jgi:hypothetical protein
MYQLTKYGCIYVASLPYITRYAYNNYSTCDVRAGANSGDTQACR